MFRRKCSAESAFVLKLLFIKFQLACYVLYKNQTYRIIAFDLVMLLRARGNAAPPNLKHILQCLMQFGRDVFPTLCIAYKLLLTIGFSIVSCERSFSKLKLMKTCIRSYMLQERLTSLALITIEREFLLADVKNEAVQVFSDRRSHIRKRNRKV